MSQTLAIELSDEVFRQVVSYATDAGLTPAEWAAQRLTQETQPAPAANGLTEAEREERRAAFYRHFGSLDSGDPRSCDNERIDADILRDLEREVSGRL